MDRDWPWKRSHTILGSSLAFVIGATIMILLHETTHAVTGALQGYHPTQLAFAVDYTPPPPTTPHVIALLAGPAFSLLSGVAGIVVDRFVTPFRDRPFWRLVWLWTLFASVQEGLGYLQITAILQAGDTAQAFDLLEAPPAAYVIATVVGWAGLPLTAWAFSVPIRALASSVDDKQDLATWPWLIGTGGLLVLMTLYVLLSPVNEPATIVAVLAGALSIGVYAPMSMMFRTKQCDAPHPPSMPWPPVAGLITLGAFVVLNLLLTQGWFWP